MPGVQVRLFVRTDRRAVYTGATTTASGAIWILDTGDDDAGSGTGRCARDNLMQRHTLTSEDWSILFWSFLEVAHNILVIVDDWLCTVGGFSRKPKGKYTA